MTGQQRRGEAGDGEGLEEEEGQLDGDSWVTTTPPQVSITATTAAELCNYAQWTGAGNNPSRSLRSHNHKEGLGPSPG